MNKIKLSIIVPAYQAEATIVRCINSILSANTDEIEVIVVDDGSDDNTPILLHNIMNDDSRLIVIRQANSGRSVARNEGLKRASGTWVMFVDADDYMVDGYYEIISKSFAGPSDCIIYRVGEIGSHCTGRKEAVDSRDLLACLLNPASNRVEKRTRKYLRNFWLRPVYARIYRRKILSGIHFERGLRFGEDLLFNCDALENRIIEACDEIIYIFDETVAGTIGSFRIEDIEYTVKFTEAIRRLRGRPSISEEDLLACMGNEIIQLAIRAARYTTDASKAIEAITSMLGSEEIRTMVASARYEGVRDAIHFGSIKVALAKREVKRAFALEKGYQALKQVIKR